MSTLGEQLAESGRNNNLNLLRMIAAFCVLVSHSYALATGDATLEPFSRSLHTPLGRMAVDVFFIASGFLICGSLASRADPYRFIVARVLRIYPALIVVTVLSAVVLGPLMTSMKTADYFLAPPTWLYIARTGTMVFGHQDGLPGVFHGNPWPDSVNGSLWTLWYEGCMYVLALSFWLAANRISPDKQTFKRLMVIVAVIGLAAYFVCAEKIDPARMRTHKLTRLFAMFFLGSAIHALKGHIINTWWIAVMALGVLVASTANPQTFLFAYPFCLAYLVFYFAFGLRGWIANYNKVGDYSYGIYILAYPAQQIIAAVWIGIRPFELGALTLLCIFPLSMGSWHFIESRALAAVPNATEWLRSAVARLRGNRTAVTQGIE